MRIRSVLLVAALSLALGGCSATVTGAAGPASGPKSGSASSDGPSTDDPGDASGFSTAPLDQPLPLPTNKGGGEGCGWLESTLPQLRSLGAVKVESTSSGCQFELDNGQGVQVFLFGPYNRMTQDTALLRPVEIAGIKGRTVAFDGPPVTFCSVELDVRAYASLKVDGYELSSDEAGDREAHCEIAKRFAEVIAKLYVPLAGGTPWPQTNQKPADDLLAKTEPCEAIRFTDVFYSGISSGRDSGRADRTELGPTCQYQDGFATATVQIVTGTGGLAQLPKRAGAQLKESSFGTLPGRTEQTADACLLSVQFGNGQVLQLEFKPKNQRDYPATCQLAQVVMASAMTSHIPVGS
jgi:hypothetical protein